MKNVIEVIKNSTLDMKSISLTEFLKIMEERFSKKTISVNYKSDAVDFEVIYKKAEIVLCGHAFIHISESDFEETYNFRFYTDNIKEIKFNDDQDFDSYFFIISLNDGSIIQIDIG